MKIKDIRASVHRLPIYIPLFNEPIAHRNHVFCEVETDNGAVGYGMTARFLTPAVAVILTNDILPAVKDMEPRDLEAIHERVARVVSERGIMTGVNLAAVSCLDLALWDIIGKQAGRTVAQLLGGFRDYATVYVTYGFGNYDRDQLADLARDLVAKGHKRLKILAAVPDKGWREDAARIRHVREAIGDDIELALDANESYSLVDAMNLCKAVEDCAIAWFEDPVHRNEIKDLAHLRRHTTIPLAAGQMDGHAARVRQYLENDAIDILLPNPMFNGGMTETRKVAYLAQIYNKPISDAGGATYFSVHHVAAFRNGTHVECHFKSQFMEENLFIGAPKPENGILRIPDAPGFGLEVDRDVLKDSRVEH
ncbi:MAG: mandelate racemase/muconate lactonizing enzyme family protein [Kiloniellaceae bacterium]